MLNIHLLVTRIAAGHLGSLAAAGLLFSALVGGTRVEAGPAKSSFQNGATVSATQNPDSEEEARRKLWSAGSISYQNEEYGLRVKLPKSWKGYEVTISQWCGGGTGPNGEQHYELGPKIVIRHPKSTEENPRQDIPIMVFTLAQWEKVDKEEIPVSAASMRPAELDRNCRYVFALPPRYNNSFPGRIRRSNRHSGFRCRGGLLSSRFRRLVTRNRATF